MTAAVVVAAGLTVAAGPVGAAGAAEGAGGADREVREALEAITTKGGVPGAQAVFGTKSGPLRVLNSGVGDLETRQPFPKPSTVRIGSQTKVFVATVVLQLVGEGKIELDRDIDHYLPGLIRQNGNDGRKITVRQLLQHRSGLPDEEDDLSAMGIEKVRYKHFTPQDLLDLALDERPLFEPGTDWSYSNTNYIVAGMLIEKITGRWWGDEVKDRIIKPLGLKDTAVPTGYGIPGAHPRGYVNLEDGRRIDITEYDTSMADAAGNMTSSGPDLVKFYDTLVNGNKLLKPAQSAAMKATSKTGAGFEYGLGIMKTKKSCGDFWGHDGQVFGWTTSAGVTTGGARAAVLLNDTITTQEQGDRLDVATDKALCS
ncbi:serine hydrolase domain-containing protein [Streptomyces huiliensis]|uniref:serine hydrolase domain-containing protein n=1 Tax=Streptomyces huiliensis TaxID=2876027 RepID=UPI001CC1014A|nr:serine hydrolase domain-containing protein [Streptomyces huiliensis]MBZ4320863.1 beta-lactamase family protein [Streptomyces huiliensis]